MMALALLESRVVFFLLFAEVSEHDTQIPTAFEHHHQSDERERPACDYEPDRPEQLPKTHNPPVYPTVAALGASIAGALPNNEPITRPPAARPKAAKPVTFSPQCKKK